MRATCLFLAVAVLSAGPVRATTKGLNQIVTPDIQPAGVLSLALQVQHQGIGNALQFQSEYGVTPRFEVAVFEGMRPGVQTLASEYGILSRGPCLLATGFTGWSTRGDKPQPFIQAGYYAGPHKAVAGLSRSGPHSELMVGYAYQASPLLAVQADYLAGQGNAATAGFTVNLTPSLSFNPALYVTNDTPRHALGYAVISWNVKLR